jgi:hypothetical protein
VSARNRIRARVRAACAYAVEHPGRFEPGPADSDWAAFAAAAAKAGCETAGPVPPSQLAAEVARIVNDWGNGGSEGRSDGRSEGLIDGLVEGRVVAEPTAAELIGAAGCEIAANDATPHSFADVSVAIACGRIAVAENGAVGIAPDDAPHRALLYLAQRLVLLVPADAVVPQMHAATIEARASCARGLCFTWMAGPSKTADIERSLVVGAHGPRALCVIGFDRPHD